MEEIILKLKAKSVGLIVDLLDDYLTDARLNPSDYAETPEEIEAIIREISEQLSDDHVDAVNLYSVGAEVGRPII